MSYRRSYTYESVRTALEDAAERNLIKEFSVTWTDRGSVRFNITNLDGRWRPYTLHEAQAFIWGVMSQVTP